MLAFQVDDRYVHGADGKRKGWVDDGRIRPDAEWHAGWMTDGSGGKRMSRVEGMVRMRETGSVVGGDCDFHLERACGSGKVLFKMGVPGGSNLTLPGTAGRNRRSSIHCGRARWMTGMRMGQIESGRAGWVTDGSGWMWNDVPDG